MNSALIAVYRMKTQGPFIDTGVLAAAHEVYAAVMSTCQDSEPSLLQPARYTASLEEVNHLHICCEPIPYPKY